MKILLTGASGYVGAKLFEDLTKSGYEVWGTHHKTKIDGNSVKVDLTNKAEVEQLLLQIKPDLIIHAAADAHSKSCEEDPVYAKKINVDATRSLVDGSKEKNIKFIYFSTFNCFNPSSFYGETKLEAEKIVSELDNYLILRLSLVIGVSPNRQSQNFFNDLLDSIENGGVVEMDTSWEFEATCLDHVVNVIEAILSMPEVKNRMIPVVATGITTRFDIAKKLLEDRNVVLHPIDQNRIIPIPDTEEHILSKLGLPEVTFDECIERIRLSIHP